MQALSAAESYEPYFKNVDTLLAKGDFDNALMWVDRGLQISPESSDLLSQKAKILDRAKRPGVAYFAGKAIENKNFKLLNKMLAIELKSAAMFREGFNQEVLDSVLSLVTIGEVLGSPDLTISIVRALNALDEGKKAQGLLEKAIEVNPYNLKLFGEKIKIFGFSSLDSSYLKDRTRQADPDFLEFGKIYANLLPASNEKNSLISTLLKLAPADQLVLFLDFESQYSVSSNKQDLLVKLQGALGTRVSGEVVEDLRKTLSAEDFTKFNESLTAKLTELNYDKNDDGWVDRRIVFENGKVKKLLQDLDFDGIFESQLSFNMDEVASFEFFDKLSGLWYFADYKGQYPYAMVDSIQSGNEVISFVHPYRKNEDAVIGLPPESISLTNASELAFDRPFLLNLESILVESSEFTVSTAGVLNSHYTKPFVSGLELETAQTVVTKAVPVRAHFKSSIPIGHYTLKDGLLRVGRLDEDGNGIVDHFVEYDTQGKIARGFRDPSGNANHWVLENYASGKLHEIQAISDTYSYTLSLDKMVAVWDLNKDGKIDIRELNLGKTSLEQQFSSRGNGIPDLLIRPNQ